MKIKATILLLLAVIFTVLLILPTKTHTAIVEIPGISHYRQPDGILVCLCPVLNYDCICALTDITPRN